MAGISSIRRLPKDVQDCINAWFDAGFTVDEVTAHLKEMGAPVSRSAVGRERKEWGKVTEEVRKADIAAKALAATFKNSPDSDMAQANVQMLQTLILNFLRTTMQDEKPALKSADFMHLSRAVNALTGARKAEVDTARTVTTAVQEQAGEGAGDGPAALEIRFVEAAGDTAEAPPADALEGPDS